MRNLEVESISYYSRVRTDITFFHNGELYSLELKTPNTNWKIEGVNVNHRPITKNIQSVVDDARKLNSRNGIAAFVLFPIPVGDNRWEMYIDRINDETGLGLSKQDNCELIKVSIDENNSCNIVVCAFMSKHFSNSLCP